MPVEINELIIRATVGGDSTAADGTAQAKDHPRPDGIYRIERVVIDLGVLKEQDFDRELTAKIHVELRRAVGDAIRAQEREHAERGLDTRIASSLELFACFTRTGSLPWWADTTRAGILEENAIELMRDAPRELAELVRELAREPEALRRISLAYADGILAGLCELLDEGRGGASFAALPPAIAELHRRGKLRVGIPATRFRSIAWQSALRAAAGAQSSGALDALCKEALTEIAEAMTLTYSELRSSFEEGRVLSDVNSLMKQPPFSEIFRRARGDDEEDASAEPEARRRPKELASPTRTTSAPTDLRPTKKGRQMRTLIISDLHLGNGGPYDVFEGGEALPALLDRMSDAPLRVLVNGDGVDFLMNDDPLELDASRASAQARAIAANPKSEAVLRAFGRVLARGGEVSIRLGNHDIELAFPAVQEILRDALGQPHDVASRLVFTIGDAPEILDLGGARVLVTHGEQDDKWNKVDYKALLKQDKGYKYAPGSVLVKKILNPGTSAHGMRFLSLLKPDFQGAALSALAVDPTAAKQLFKGATIGMLMQLFKRSGTMPTFAEEDERPEDIPLFSSGGQPPAADIEGSGDPEVPLSEDDVERRLRTVHLDPEEQEAMQTLLDDSAPLNFAGDDDTVVGRASVKIARAALGLYARLQRGLTGKQGDDYFAIEPTEDEWTEAQRLAKKFNAGAVIIGHTHAARWKQESDLLYANTGTWIGLMQLPRSDATEEDWLEYLNELRVNKGLDVKGQRRAKILTRFTAVVAEASPGGGASLSLVEWKDGEISTLGAARVPPANTK